jgi:hypothetical protein
MSTPHEAASASAPALPLPHIMGWGAIDMLGLALLVQGATWFINGRGLFFAGYPGTPVEAGICLAFGASLAGLAMFNIVKLVRPKAKGQPGEVL